MRYVLCIFMPPIAVLTTGRVGAFFLCILLTLLGWLPGLIYSILIVNKYYADERHRELMQMHALSNRGSVNVNMYHGHYPPQGQYQNPQQHPGQYPQQQDHYLQPGVNRNDQHNAGQGQNQ